MKKLYFMLNPADGDVKWISTTSLNFQIDIFKIEIQIFIAIFGFSMKNVMGTNKPITGSVVLGTALK